MIEYNVKPEHISQNKKQKITLAATSKDLQ